MSVSLTKELHFSVDSALLRELGERLVGKPHIALAELVKNSYDADASNVVIWFEDDRISVEDNGSGMTLDEFRDFWMRIGSPHKERQKLSRKLQRSLTGSKGVGRLSVQFLAKHLMLETASEVDIETRLVATVDWREAVSAGDLTSARALYEEMQSPGAFAGGARHGTRLVLSELNHPWGPDEFRDLARELWPLQPPFAAFGAADLAEQDFTVRLESPHRDVAREFEDQMRAVLEIWHARLRGRLVRQGSEKEAAHVELRLDFADGRSHSMTYEIEQCSLHEVSFEIRVFHLQHRQPKGIRVPTAREYLNRYGGVHVYDAGFHLPYYGADTDWLRIEIDHSHRKSRSGLLPEGLQVAGGLSFLPTNSRLFGVVHVNTAREREELRDEASTLQIQVSRDRLVSNAAFRDLQRIVRWGLDYYAMEEARRSLGRDRPRPAESLEKKIARVDRVLAKYRENLPSNLFETLTRDIRSLFEDAAAEDERLSKYAGLLGALATAGVAALAYEHEVNKQFHLLERIAADLRELDLPEAAKSADRIDRWIERAQATRRLFAPLLDEDNRESKGRFEVKNVVGEVVKQLKPFLRGVAVRTSGLPKTWTLPEGRYVEWSAIFQNIFVNSVNAMREAETRMLSVTVEEDRAARAVLVHDTGVGVNLASSAELFEPFVRKLEIPEGRRVFGLGGSGLGLTIVRMIARNLGVTVSFVPPLDGYRTSFRIGWIETDE